VKLRHDRIRVDEHTPIADFFVVAEKALLGVADAAAVARAQSGFVNSPRRRSARAAKSKGGDDSLENLSGSNNG
jgi:hypothetical protein